MAQDSEMDRMDLLHARQPNLTQARLTVVPFKLGIIRQRFDIPIFRSFDPQYAPLMDEPRGRNKSSPIVVPVEWIRYMRSLMTAEAWSWWKRPFMLMVNRRHMFDDLDPPSDDECRFENIMLPCNFIAVDKVTYTHSRVVSRLNYHDTSQLDPRRNNWFFEPHLFWKASMHNAEGLVRNVGTGLDVYTPVIRQQPEQWALNAHIEFFPDPPFEVTYDGKRATVRGYCLLGASVFGSTDSQDIPLRLCVRPRVWIHPTEWKLETAPVIPAVPVR